MFGSNDSIDFVPEFPVIEDRVVIPLRCWQDISLPSIWIPSKLLTSRKKPSNSRIAEGIFHTLEKNDSAKCIEGFSVYSEDEEEIFQSDSDDDILHLETDSSEKHEGYTQNLSENTLAADTGNSFKDFYDKNDGVKICQNRKNEVSQNAFSSLQHCKVNDYEKEGTSEGRFNQKEKKKTSSQISLNEILDDTPEIDVKYFKSDFSKCNEFLGVQEKKSERVQQKKKKKAKAQKSVIALGKFLENYDKNDYQDDCCNDFFNKLLRNKHKDGSVQLRNTAEFPNLASNEFKFMHSKKIKTNSEPSTVNKMDEIKSLLSIQKTVNAPNLEPNSDSPADVAIQNTHLEQHPTSGKIVIENLPREVSPDDIHALLCGYGEIKSFSLKSVGEFHKVYVEFEDCDVEWITESLNGTEPFGASSKMLKCYQQQ